MPSITITAILLLCVLIAIIIVQICTRCVLRNLRCGSVFFIVPVYKDSENIEMQIRDLAVKMKWDDNCLGGKIFMININAAEETLQICRKLCKEYVFLELWDIEELEKNIRIQNSAV